MARPKKNATPAVPKRGRGRPRKVVNIGERQEGDHVRTKASQRAVETFIDQVIATKNATSEVGQELSTATKRAQELGVNIPAARVAARFVSKAKADPMKARVLLEDTIYYLDCMDFDRLAPKGMFTPAEGGQGRQKEPEPEQSEIPEGAFESQRQREAAAEFETTSDHVH